MSKELKGKSLFNRISGIIPKLDAYLANVISYAYENPILICSPALSRNPFSSSLIVKIAQEVAFKKSSLVNLGILGKLAKYYLENLFFFTLYFFQFVTHRISNLNFREQEIDKNESLVIINTFVMIDRIYPKKRFVDDYFGEIYEIMAERKKQYIILCFLFGDRPWNLKRRFKTYNILANDGRNFITDFELLKFRDWLTLVQFILLYPFSALRLIRGEFGKFDEFFREEVIATLDSVQFPQYLRYLVGRRLNHLTNQKLKVISWWENQVIDKMLFRGIRDARIDAKIFGCQFFIKCPQWTNLYPLDEEAKYDVVPDVVLVAGKYYLSESSVLNLKLGISPRYDYLFDLRLDSSKISARVGLLVLLPYSVEDSKRIIEMVEKYRISNRYPMVTVRCHPTHLLTRPLRFPNDWRYSEESLEVLCPRTSAVITSESSTALEAVVMGCSVIIVGSENGLTFNPMPEYGRHKIWELIFDEFELKRSLMKLGQYRQDNPGEITEVAEKLRDLFFTKATEKKYSEVFEL